MNDEFRIHPNPLFGNHINLSNANEESYSYEIVGINGITIEKGLVENLSNKIDVLSVKKGIFILIPYSKNHRILHHSKFIRI